MSDQEVIDYSNKVFAATDPGFRAACTLAEVEPTARQASKYRRKLGVAYLYREYCNNNDQPMTVAEFKLNLTRKGVPTPR